MAAGAAAQLPLQDSVHAALGIADPSQTATAPGVCFRRDVRRDQVDAWCTIRNEERDDVWVGPAAVENPVEANGDIGVPCAAIVAPDDMEKLIPPACSRHGGEDQRVPAPVYKPSSFVLRRGANVQDRSKRILRWPCERVVFGTVPHDSEVQKPKRFRPRTTTARKSHREIDPSHHEGGLRGPGNRLAASSR